LTPELIAKILLFYLVLALLNFFIAALQSYLDKNKCQKTLAFYWLSICLSVIFNAFLKNKSLELVIACAATGFFGQCLLGSFFAQSTGLKVNYRPQILFLAIMFMVTILLYKFGAPFEIYALVAVVGASNPIFFTGHFVLKEKTRPLTTTQKMFMIVTLIVALHFWDWPYFSPRPELFILGMTIAFLVYHVQSIILPMMANEYLLLKSNEELEDEVKRRAEQLAEKERQLWEVNKLASLGRMAGGVAHEINNPLSIISMHADNLRFLAEHEILNKTSIIESASKIQDVIERISKITLALRRVARDQQYSEKAGIDLRVIINEAVDLYSEKMKSLDIHFHASVPESPVMVACNSVEISQVLLNLLSNAADAVENLEKKSITLSLSSHDHFAEVKVEDSGTISENVTAKVMEPFFTTKPVGKGIGLGLSISKSIIESHGGTLRLDKTAPNTCFIFLLPLGP
jgi:signal transduction histidine kinase